MFLAVLETIGSPIRFCSVLQNFKTFPNSFFRTISLSIVSDNKRDKYQDIWGEDFDSFLKMPKSKEHFSSDESVSDSSEEEKKSKKRPRKGEKKSKSDDKVGSKKKENSSSKNDDNEKSWDLGNKKRVAITEFRGAFFVDIREMYNDKNTDELKPGIKGISLNPTQWKKLLDNVQAIDKVVKTKE